MYELPRHVIADRSDELLELMGLQDDAGKLIIDYSHGMKKKLSFCAAIIHEPRVLFLDEPFEGIDAVASRLVRTLLGRLVTNGVTIFLTSHILEIVERLCTEVAIIHRGRLVAHGPMGELQSAAGPDGEASSLEATFLSLVGGGRLDQGLSWLE
jgi:ABC-2 type transport system ATP-binding protein